MPDKTELSIIIVTWNSQDEIEKCLESVFNNTENLEFEVIVIDNNSSDKTAETVQKLFGKEDRKTRLIINNENKGYTAACNQGIAESTGNSILFLNPDTVFCGNPAEILLKKLYEDKLNGAVAPQLLNEDKTIQKSCRTFPRYFDMFCEMSLISYIFPGSILLSNWKMNYFSHNEERAVEQPMAAALMVKKEVLNETGFFDEDFFMFFNDVDLCRRITGNGYRIIFYPEAKIIHGKGVSIYKDRVRMIKAWNKDCLNYFRKHNYSIVLYNLLLISLTITGIFRILFYKLFR